MEVVCVPGVNGLGATKGVESTCESIVEGKEFYFVLLDGGNLEEQLKKIREESFLFLKKGKCFFIGGDHSISFPLVDSFFQIYGKDSKLLVFDAHPDLMEPMKEPTHEEWLRALVENGFPSENILLVGVRRNSLNVDKSEINFAKERGVKIIYSDEFKVRESEIFDFVSSGKIYFSLDIDVFDSLVISSTGYPEKNGLSEKDFFSVVREKRFKKNIFAVDLVEINFLRGNKKSRLKTKEISQKILNVFIK